ncbi:phosphotransferase [Streptomyces sp. TRM70308]|uniref:phosphotransferase family protein n=2 Tax=Streptomyces sp. TRM70308 TaxID=3131932 RepID=UPI003D033D67
MSTLADPRLPAVAETCAALGLDSRDIVPLRQHATAIYLLPRAGAVVRCSPLTTQGSLTTTMRLVHWLLEQGFPATEPLELEVEQPVAVPSLAAVLTIWHHYPQPRPTPPARHLGTLLRSLHDLPPPPVPLAPYEPLAALHQTVTTAQRLPAAARAWLLQAIDARMAEYRSLDLPLGHGLIHGDAYPGNTLWDGDAVRLGDWDEAGIGPRELDLANTFQGVRFGRTERELREFAAAYGGPPIEPRTLRTLTGLRDLHTLGAFIRRADTGDPDARDQLTHRLGTLQRDEQEARWDVH